MTPKNAPRGKAADHDMLDNLGALIGKQIKKGASKFEYVRTFLDDRNIGSVTPSSKYLVDRMVRSAALEDAKIVVEYGAAEGVITRALLRKMRPDARLIAVEFNEDFYARLCERVKDSRLVPIRGDVREIEKILAAQGLGKADRIVSGVPFALFTGRERHEILTKTSDLLNPGGRFVAFGYTTHLIPMLKDYFRDVDIQFEVRNIPPSFIFTALK